MNEDEQDRPVTCFPARDFLAVSEVVAGHVDREVGPAESSSEDLDVAVGVEFHDAGVREDSPVADQLMDDDGNATASPGLTDLIPLVGVPW